ncbi:MAG: hypothetical protein PHD15_03525 [Clostridia bacterium]|nr:hypothetical protein [Clostridia bacterium]MDD4386812.1 hypothetical protein [Clostridia bacterium]
MNDFTVNLNIKDECCTKCGNTTLQKEVIITSFNQTIDLQGCYILNVIEVGPSFIKVIIQNGMYVIIRTIFPTYAMQVSLPSDCNTKHVITICTQVCRV